MHLLIYTQVMDREDPILGFFVSWVREFSKTFDRIDVICLKKGIYDLPPHVRVHSLGKEEGKGKLTYVYRFYRLFWTYSVREPCDFVLFHMGAVANVLAAPFFFIRAIRNTSFYWWKTYGHVSMLERCALLFSDRVYTAVPESFPVQTSKRQIIGHAIDTELFSYGAQKQTERTLVFVGRLSRIKRVEQVIEVARLLRDSGHLVFTRIVGSTTDIAYEQELKALVLKLGLESSVRFVGSLNQEELVEEYRGAVVLMNPSDTDGLDKVVLEAMLCGTIPVTANRSFEHMLSPYGLFMKKNDVEGYADCIQKLLDMPPTERQKTAYVLHDIVVHDHALSTLTYRLFGL